MRAQLDQPGVKLDLIAAALQHRNRVTAYAGKTLTGVVKSTWLRGERIVTEGEFGRPAGHGDERAHPASVTVQAVDRRWRAS